MNKNYQPKYWNSRGKYQKKYDRLFEKLVPREGKSKQDSGEILRLASKIYYDIFNNGGGNIDDCRWMEDLGRLLPSYSKGMAGHAFSKPYRRYELMDKVMDWIILYVEQLNKMEELWEKSEQDLKYVSRKI